MRVDQIIFLLGLVVALAIFLSFKRAKKKRPYGQTYEDVETPVTKPVKADGTTPEKLSFKKRLGGIAFLTVWLSIWTFGVFVAGSTWLSMSQGEVGYFFLMIWLVIAVPAWGVAAWTLFRLLRGDDVEFEMDGKE